MDYREVEELLPGYALNALSPDETALVEAHLETCHWCTELLREHVLVASSLWPMRPNALSIPRGSREAP